MVGDCHRTGPNSFGACSGGAPHVVGTGTLQHLHTSSTIVWRVGSVRIHTNDDLSARGADCRIQSRGNDSTGVGSETQLWVASAVCLENPARAVVAHAVGDDRFPRDVGH